MTFLHIKDCDECFGGYVHPDSNIHCSYCNGTGIAANPIASVIAIFGASAILWSIAALIFFLA